MVLLVDETTERAAAQSSALAPYEGREPGLFESLSANLAATMEYRNLNAEHRNRLEAQRQFQVEFYRESGQQLPGWVDSMYVDAFDTARKQFDAWKTQHPESRLAFPTGEEFQKRADDIALSFKERADDVSRRSISLSSSIGAFLGSAGGTVTDPVNLLSMGFGAGPSQGILRTALMEAGINMAAETAVQGGTYQRNVRLDPNFTLADAAEQIVAAGVGGAVLGGGVKALSRTWSGVADRFWPSSVRDAARVVERDAIMPDAPFPGSVVDDVTHEAAFARVYADLTEERLSNLAPIDAEFTRRQVLASNPDLSKRFSSAESHLRGAEDTVSSIERFLANRTLADAVGFIDETSGARLREIEAELSAKPKATRRRALETERDQITEGFGQEAIAKAENDSKIGPTKQLKNARQGAAAARQALAKVQRALDEAGAAMQAEAKVRAAVSSTDVSELSLRAFQQSLKAGAFDPDRGIKAWARLRADAASGLIPRGLDITDHLVEADRILSNAARGGRTAAEAISQPEMFGGPSEMTKLAARAMFSDAEMTKPRSQADVAKFMQEYAEEVVKPAPLPVVTRIGPAVEDIQTVARAAELVDAQIHFAEHLTIDQPDLTIDLGDGKGERSLADLLAEAKSEIAAGREIEACIIGKDMD